MESPGHSQTNPCFINRLPAELLLRTFSLCVPTYKELLTYSTAFYGVSDKIHNTPLVLSYVCATWRVLALASNVLWTHLPVAVGTKSANNLCTFTHLLERSQDLPLSIYLTWPRSMQISSANPSPNDLLPTFTALAGRLKTLVMSEILIDALRDLLTHNAGLPILETLQISSSCDVSDSFLWRDFAHSPRLTSLQAPPEICTSHGVPWSSLTSLTFRHDYSAIAHGDALNLLLRCPHLERYEVWNLTEFEDDRALTEGPIVTALHLRVLGLRIDSSHRSFFPKLVAPALSELSITWQGQARGLWAHADFLAFLALSRDTLKSLALIDAPMTEAWVVDCLGALPMLQSVYVDDTHARQRSVGRDVVDAVTRMQALRSATVLNLKPFVEHLLWVSLRRVMRAPPPQLQSLYIAGVAKDSGIEKKIQERVETSAAGTWSVSIRRPSMSHLYRSDCYSVVLGLTRYGFLVVYQITSQCSLHNIIGEYTIEEH